MATSEMLLLTTPPKEKQDGIVVNECELSSQIALGLNSGSVPLNSGMTLSKELTQSLKLPAS